MFSADVRDKLFVAKHLEVLFHFIERLSAGWASRVEDPTAFGTSPTPKARLVYPHQLARHRSTIWLPRCSDKVVSKKVSNMGQMGHVTSALLKNIMSQDINNVWVETYLRAALEVDGQKMPERIVAAREAVAGRLRTWKAIAIIMRSGTRCNRHWPL